MLRVKIEDLKGFLRQILRIFTEKNSLIVRIFFPLLLPKKYLAKKSDSQKKTSNVH